MTIGNYARLSKNKATIDLTIARQHRDGDAIIEAKWPGEDVIYYADKAKSAYDKKVKRHGYLQMIEDLRERRITGIVGYNFDRVFRRPRELEDFLDLAEDLHLSRVATAQGDIDLTKDDNQLHARILVAVAKKSSDDTRRRIKRTQLDREEDGRHHGGKVVWSYTLVDGMPVLDPARGALMSEVADLVVSGMSLRSAAKYLVSRDPTAPATGAGIKKMLLSPTLVGRNTSGKRGQWDACITDNQRADLIALLNAPDRGPLGGRAPRRNWITGIAKCGREGCGKSLRPRVDTDGQRSYICYGCFGVAIRADMLMNTAETKLFERIEPMRQVKVEQARATNTDIDDRIAMVTALYMKKKMKESVYLAAMEEANRELDQAPRQLEPMPDFIEQWRAGKLTPEQKHAQARRVVTRIVVMPRVVGGVLRQTDRVKMEWITPA